MIKLDSAVVKKMKWAMRLHLKTKDYKEARDLALQSYTFSDTTEEEMAAYKHHLDEYFSKAARAALKRKHRPRAPIETYEGDTR